MSLMEIVTIVTTIVTVASIVAAVTPTPKDDEWMSKFYSFIDLLAINIGKAKDRGIAEVVKVAAAPKAAPKAKSGAKKTAETSATTAKK